MRRRTVSVAIVSAVVLIVAALVGVLVVDMTSAKTTAWVVTHDLATGASVDGSAVHQIQVKTGADTYTVQTESPVGKQVSHSVRTGDVLRPDDFVTSMMVQVPVTFKLAPGLHPNDVVDVYAVGGGGSSPSPSAVSPAVSSSTAPPTSAAAAGTRRIAKGVTVIAVDSPAVIEVPAAQEPFWVTLASSSVTLIAARSSGLNVPSSDHSYLPDEVLNILAQSASGNSGNAPGGSGNALSPSPSPSPSGRP